MGSGEPIGRVERMKGPPLNGAQSLLASGGRKPFTLQRHMYRELSDGGANRRRHARAAIVGIDQQDVVGQELQRVAARLAKLGSPKQWSHYRRSTTAMQILVQCGNETWLRAWRATTGRGGMGISIYVLYV
jgi:hypothetical protein